MGKKTIFERTTVKANDQVSLKRMLEPLRRLSVSTGHQDLRSVARIQVKQLLSKLKEVTFPYPLNQMQ